MNRSNAFLVILVFLLYSFPLFSVESTQNPPDHSNLERYILYELAKKGSEKDNPYPFYKFFIPFSNRGNEYIRKEENFSEHKPSSIPVNPNQNEKPLPVKFYFKKEKSSPPPVPKK